MHFILGRTFMSNSVCGIEKTQFSPIFVTLGTRSRIQVFTTSRQSRLPLGKTNQISENSTFFQKNSLFSFFFTFLPLCGTPCGNRPFVRNPLRWFFLKGGKWETVLAEVGFGFEGVEMAAEMCEFKQFFFLTGQKFSLD